MRIKKRNKDNYLLVKSANTSIWIRDFTVKNPNPIDINDFYTQADKIAMLKNEIGNSAIPLQNVDNLSVKHPKCIIVSDGYGFEEKLQFLMQLPDDIAIITVNGALKNWKLKKSIHYFVINNPYKEALLQVPTHSYFPMCLASTRTYMDFFKRYKGYTAKYVPVPQEGYQTKFHAATSYKIDEYRNPICAAISLAYQFRVEKLALFCCDEAFTEDKPGAEKLDNGLYMYPQQIMAHDIIDTHLYWLTHNQEERQIEVKTCSSGPKYSNATYISEEDIVKYFTEE